MSECVVSRRRFVRSAGALIAAPVFTSDAWGQGAAANYPTRPIRLVVGFSPGGATDIVARLVAAKLQESWGQPVVVDNRAGGGSNIGSEFVAKATPDGHALLLLSIANATNMSIYKNLGYDTLRDFVPITQTMAAPSVLVVHPGLPVATLSELIAYAK
ncbi:MAG: tripartite tricarboxylate transporter substrate-binding protein, partial [Burkholderiales bacterium]